MKVTDAETIKGYLSLDYRWRLYNRLNGWMGEDFDINQQDIEDIKADLDKKYAFERQKPYAEIFEDGKVVIHYPKACRFERLPK